MTTLTPEQVRANQNNKWFPVPNLPRSAYIEPPRSEYLRTLPRQAPRGFLEGSDSSLLQQAVVSQTRSKEALMISQDIRFETDRALERALGREYIIPKRKKRMMITGEAGGMKPMFHPRAISATDFQNYKDIMDFGRQRGFIGDEEQKLTERLFRRVGERGINPKVLSKISELLKEETPHGRAGFLEDPDVYQMLLRGLVEGKMTVEDVIELQGDVSFEDDFEEAELGMEIEAGEEEMYRNPFEPSLRPPTLREAWRGASRDIDWLHKSGQGRPLTTITQETVGEMVEDIALDAFGEVFDENYGWLAPGSGLVL
jgi:hypothetical protein